MEKTAFTRPETDVIIFDAADVITGSKEKESDLPVIPIG